MYSYFKLQFRIILRIITEFGLSIYIGIPLAISGFIGGSYLMHAHMEYVHFIYPTLGFLSVFTLNESQRNVFLKSIFKSRDYFKIRVVENVFWVSPFALFLMIYGNVLASSLLVLGSSILAIFPISMRVGKALPTPFYKWPFEFSTGFRRYFWLFGLTYVLLGIALNVGNFNLGLFAIGIGYLTCILFYLNPEPIFYVWMHKMNSTQFIVHKLAISIGYSTVVILPMAVALGVAFPIELTWVVLVITAGTGYLGAIILAKYASFPKSISLPQAMVIGFTLYYPIILIGVIPVLFFQVGQRLKTYLK